MNILAIGSHPDDIEIGCAGTLIKSKERGHDIFFIVMSKGERGGDPTVRYNEQINSANLIGVSEIFWGDFLDTKIPINTDIIQWIEKIIFKIKADYIFCHYKQDAHQDHRHLTQMVMSASRNVGNVLLYEGPSTENFEPHTFVDISNYMGKKHKTLLSHKSQVEKTNIKDVSILKIASANAIFRGAQCHVKYAEAFRAVRLFLKM